ncbi:MAG: hypothetical protein HRT45_18215 [Bdellovibrionales bacterium]|nr:hypothetical protein [Bdellovibrionales bacterium]
MGLFLILVFSVEVFAKTNLSSDFYFVMKPTEYQQVIEKQVKLELDEQLEDLEIEEPFTTKAERINIKANVTFNLQHTPGEPNHMSFSAEVDSLSLMIGLISTNDEVVTQRGNIRLVTKILGSCQGFEASYDGRSVSLSGTLNLANTDVSPAAELSISEIQLDDSWALAAENCDGFEGYEDQVSKALVDLLTDEELLKEKLQPQLQAQAQKQLDDLSNDVLQPQQKSLPNAGTMTFLPDRISYDHPSLSLVVSGEVRSEFLGTEGVTEEPFEILHRDLLQMQQSQILLSKKFIQTASHQFYSHGLYKAGFESQEIKSMRDFQNNRLFQFFVFPEIMKFPRNANFIINGYLNSAPTIRYQGERQGIIYWNTTGKANLDSYAPKSNGYVPFLRFLTDYSVSGWMQVKEGKLNVGFYSPDMKVQHGWFKVYLDTYSPNKWFKKNPIVKEIKDLMKRTQFDFQLPEFPIEGHGDLKPVEMQMTEDYLHMIYELDPVLAN